MNKYCDLHVPKDASVQPVFYSFADKCTDCANFAKWEDAPIVESVIEDEIEA